MSRHPFVVILGDEGKLYADVTCPLCHIPVGMFKFSPEDEHKTIEFKCNVVGCSVTIEIHKENGQYRCEWSASLNKGD